MQRREFFKFLGGAGLCCSSVGLLRGAEASDLDLIGGRHMEAGEYTGPFWISVSAQGGWDTTMLCDPHPGLNGAYGSGGVKTAGAISYPSVGNHDAFFTKHAERLMVINGIDTSTNNHQIGRRNIWTGHADATHPALGALIAGSYAPQLPMAFVAEGTYDVTKGLVSETRVNNTDVLQELSYPGLVNPADVEDLRTYHAEPTSEMIGTWRTERALAMAERQNLPRIDHAIDNMLTVRTGSNELALLQEYLPDPLANNALRRKFQIALAAYKAGIAVSASFAIGGFDTHFDNDNRQIGRQNAYLGHVDFLWEEAMRQGVADSIVIVMGSDFARTPDYNARGGKDHWSVTSMMLMGAGIPGNTVVGATDGGQRARKLDPQTLEPSDDGVTLQPKHVHKALRKLAEIPESVDARFPLDVEELSLFA